MKISCVQCINSIKETSMGGLFWSYINLICFSHSRDGSPRASPVPTSNPTSTIPFDRLAPLLYFWHVPETVVHQPPPTAQPSLLSFLDVTTPCLPNLIKLINSFHLLQFHSISFFFLLSQNPSYASSFWCWSTNHPWAIHSSSVNCLLGHVYITTISGENT